MDNLDTYFMFGIWRESSLIRYKRIKDVKVKE